MTIILLAILPNWNSLDSVRRAHSDLEAAGLLFFALLVIAEALAHNSRQENRKHLFDSIGIWFFAIAVLSEIGGYWYGKRNDALSEKVIVSLDAMSRNAASNASTALTESKEAETKSSDALDKAGKAIDKSNAANAAAGKALSTSKAARDVAVEAQEKISAVDEELAATEYSVSGRYVINFDSLVEQLRQYKGRPIIFVSYANDIPESAIFCNSLASAAHAAEMKDSNECGTKFALGHRMSDGVVMSGPDLQEVTNLFRILLRNTHFGPSGLMDGIRAPELTILVGTQEPFLMKQVRGVKAPAKALPREEKQPER